VSARDEILSRIRSALDGADRSVVPAPRGYRDRPRDRPPEELVDLFAERVEDYRATVTRCTEEAVAEAVGRLVPEGARVLLPPGLPWPVSGDVDSGFTAAELDGYDAVVTAATVGIAETGTIVLTHTPAEGRRALSLVPDLHVCVVRAEQVVADVPSAVAGLDPVRPQTWVSGPSATSDIELDRVEGVHGPRTLHVVLVS
jgi:L-lactate dehydrogenase complex protein LldG